MLICIMTKTMTKTMTKNKMQNRSLSQKLYVLSKIPKMFKLVEVAKKLCTLFLGRTFFKICLYTSLLSNCLHHLLYTNTDFERKDLWKHNVPKKKMLLKNFPYKSMYLVYYDIYNLNLLFDLDWFYIPFFMQEIFHKF